MTNGELRQSFLFSKVPTQYSENIHKFESEIHLSFWICNIWLPSNAQKVSTDQYQLLLTCIYILDLVFINRSNDKLKTNWVCNTHRFWFQIKKSFDHYSVLVPLVSNHFLTCYHLLNVLTKWMAPNQLYQNLVLYFTPQLLEIFTSKLRSYN